METPRPHLWTAGDQPSAESFNEISDAIEFLSNPPAAYVWASTTQSMSNATFTALNHQNELRDNDGMWSAGNPSRLTCQTSGWYELEYGIFYGSAADFNWRTPAIRKNGNTFVAQSSMINCGADIMLRACYDMYLYAGEYLELMGYQASGGSLSTAAGSLTGDHTFLSATWTSF